MKTIVTTLSILTAGTLLNLSAQTTEKRTDVTTNPDGSVTKTETTTTTFNPEARTKVVKYFETYKTNPHGLPPAWITKMKLKEIPVTWRTAQISPGLVIPEKERPFLVEAPPELVQILPTATGEVRYYVAGSNVVAVDKTYKVVDSVRIPSIKIVVDD